MITEANCSLQGFYWKHTRKSYFETMFFLSYLNVGKTITLFLDVFVMYRLSSIFIAEQKQIRNRVRRSLNL